MIIIPKAGLTQNLFIQLKTEAEAKVAAIPSTIKAMENLTAKLIIPDRFKMGSSQTPHPHGGSRGAAAARKEAEAAAAIRAATLSLPRGHCMCHAAGLRHAGQRITKGIRKLSSYIHRLSYQPCSPRKKPWSDV